MKTIARSNPYGAFWVSIYRPVEYGIIKWEHVAEACYDNTRWMFQVHVGSDTRSIRI